MRFLLVLTAFAAFSSASAQQIKDGKTLYSRYLDYQKMMRTQGAGISLTEAHGVGLYIGYIEGFFNGAVASNAIGTTYCIPGNVTMMQLYDVVGSFVETRSEFRHFPVGNVISEALKQAFPCAPASEPPPPKARPQVQM